MVSSKKQMAYADPQGNRSTAAPRPRDLREGKGSGGRERRRRRRPAADWTAMGQATKYDDTLFAMMQQHENEMEFLNTVFGFLQRKSTCFNGPKVRSDI